MKRFRFQMLSSSRVWLFGWLVVRARYELRTPEIIEWRLIMKKWQSSRHRVQRDGVELQTSNSQSSWPRTKIAVLHWMIWYEHWPSLQDWAGGLLMVWRFHLHAVYLQRPNNEMPVHCEVENYDSGSTKNTDTRCTNCCIIWGRYPSNMPIHTRPKSCIKLDIILITILLFHGWNYRTSPSTEHSLHKNCNNTSKTTFDIVPSVIENSIHSEFLHFNMDALIP